MAQSQTPIPPANKLIRKFEQGRYTATDVRWGMALDLSGVDYRSLIAYGFHGQENQQWEFHPCGAGFIIGSVVRSGSFLAVRDLKGLHLEGAAAVVTETFPTCWEVEVVNTNGNKSKRDHAENDDAGEQDDEKEDVYVRIQLPNSEMALSFKGSYAGSPLFLTKERDNLSTYWRLSPVPALAAKQQVVKNPPISTTKRVRKEGADGAVTTTTVITTTTCVTTTTRTVTRITAGDVHV